MSKNKGWIKEPARHALAAQGVKTKYVLGTLKKGASGREFLMPRSFEGFPRLNMTRDIEKGLTTASYGVDDARDDVGFTSMALTVIQDEFDDDDRETYNVRRTALINDLYEFFEDPTGSLSAEEIHTWEKWLNIAYNHTEKGSDFDKADAYLDAIEKYAYWVKGQTDDPQMAELAEGIGGHAHDLLKMWS